MHSVIFQIHITRYSHILFVPMLSGLNSYHLDESNVCMCKYIKWRVMCEPWCTENNIL